jgi:MoxR-like ATPase
MKEVRQLAARLMDNVQQVILGKPDVVEQTVIALLCQGHVLFEDVPGVGKTMLARAIARSLGGTFKRLQFTPDLLPSDVTGVSIFQPETGGFRFREGPIFANIVLADELNRASPKTQSSLLECMEEAQVTVDGETYLLPQPFLVLATQNPIEHEGIYPLPESQLDRFMMRLHLGYPDREVEKQMIQRQSHRHPIEGLEPVATAAELVKAQEAIKDVHIDETVYDYLLEIVGQTREAEHVAVGASPRGSLWLARGARALAALRGRRYVIPDDVKELARPILAHRLIIRPEARLSGVSDREIIGNILWTVKVL